MTLGQKSTDRYREATSRLTPSGSIKRQRCDGCGVTRSLGQFPLNSSTCISCEPQGRNFRRGTL